MTDSELQERMDEAIRLIQEAIEERGGLLERKRNLTSVGLVWPGFPPAS